VLYWELEHLYTLSVVAHNARDTKVWWTACVILGVGQFVHFVSQLLHIMLGIPKSSFIPVKYVHGRYRKTERCCSVI
jgi:hypothetical protein